MHHLHPQPMVGDAPLVFPAEQIPGKTNVEVFPLNSWTWKRTDVISQLTPPVPKPSSVADDPPPDPEYRVEPVPYSTGFKSGQLIRMHFPSHVASSGFL